MSNDRKSEQRDLDRKYDESRENAIQREVDKHVEHGMTPSAARTAVDEAQADADRQYDKFVRSSFGRST